MKKLSKKLLLTSLVTATIATPAIIAPVASGINVDKTITNNINQNAKASQPSTRSSYLQAIPVSTVLVGNYTGANFTVPLNEISDDAIRSYISTNRNSLFKPYQHGGTGNFKPIPAEAYVDDKAGWCERKPEVNFLKAVDFRFKQGSANTGSVQFSNNFSLNFLHIGTNGATTTLNKTANQWFLKKYKDNKTSAEITKKMVFDELKANIYKLFDKRNMGANGDAYNPQMNDANSTLVPNFPEFNNYYFDLNRDLREESIKLNAQPEKGILNITFELDKVYKAGNFSSTPTQFNIAIDGFALKGDPTIVAPTVQVTAPLNNEYVIDINYNNLLAWARQNYKGFITSLPGDFIVENHLDLKRDSAGELDAVVNKKASSIDVILILKRSFKDNGYSTHETREFPITLTGFKPLAPSVVVDYTLVDETDAQEKQMYVSQISEEYLSAFLVNGVRRDKIFKFLPKNARISNVKILKKSYWDGRIQVQAQFDKWFDKDLNIIPSGVLNFSISGFMHPNVDSPQEAATEVADYQVRAPLSNLYAEEANDQDIINQMYDNYTSFILKYPIGFSRRNDIIIELKPINTEDKRLGERRATVRLKKYISQTGDYVEKLNPGNTDPSWDIKITGFWKKDNTIAQKTIDTTNFGPFYKYANQVTVEDVKSVIINFKNDIFQNLPRDIDLNNDLIIQKISERDYVRGAVKVVYTMRNAWFENLQQITKTDLVITITGFKRPGDNGLATGDTVIEALDISKTNYKNSSLIDLDWNAFVNDYLKPNYDLFIKNVPVDFDINTNATFVPLDASKLTLNEKANGVINAAQVKLTSYIQNGKWYDTELTFTFKITGFRRLSEYQYIKQGDQDIKNDPELSKLDAKQVTEQQIKTYIINHYDEFYSGMDASWAQNILTESLTVEIVERKPMGDWDVTPPTPYEQKPYIKVKITFDKFVNANLNYESNVQNIIFIGFKEADYRVTGVLNPIIAKTIFPEGVSGQDFNIFASIVQNADGSFNNQMLLDKIKTYDTYAKLKDKILQGFPENANISLNVNKIKNREGKILLTITTDKYYSDDNHTQLINQPKDFYTEITGFKISQATYLENPSIGIKEVSSKFDSVFPTKVIDSLGTGNFIDVEFKQYVVDYCIKNKPAGFNASHLEITPDMLVADNNTGILEIKYVGLKLYKNDEGVDQTANKNIYPEERVIITLSPAKLIQESNLSKWINFVVIGSGVIGGIVIIAALIAVSISLRNRFVKRRF